MPMSTLRTESVDPRVLVAAGTEELRVLLMQYVAIEWPHAEIVELDTSAMETARSESAAVAFDIVCVAFNSEETEGIGWLDRLPTQASDAPVVAITENNPLLRQAYLARGAYCLNRSALSNSTMRTTLRAAMRERLAGIRETERTMPDHSNVGQAGEITQPSRPLASRQIHIPGYTLLKRLGRGGMSEVFLAQREDDYVVCALKVLSASNVPPATLDFFIKECTAVSALDSPYVVRIFDHGITDEYLFVAMEYISGGDLGRYIALGVTPQQAEDILNQLARALATIHDAGRIHGDIKPQNIMFRNAQGLVLVDFGISRRVDISTVRMSGQVVGTPTYISPEQVLGRTPDARADLYSAGVLLFEMLTGRKPFAAKSVPQLLKMHVETPMTRLPNQFAKYQPILDKLTAKRPEDRIQNARELILHLETQYFGGDQKLTRGRDNGRVT
jgi:eukaryotic-like serine/threonine-protein kinase